MKATELTEKINSIAERAIKPGTRVRVKSGGSGVDSGKEGVVVDWSEVKTKQTGGGMVPDLPGEYKPLDRDRKKKEVPVRTDDGDIFTMFKNRLEVIG